MAIKKKFKTIDDILDRCDENRYFKCNTEMFMKLANFMFSCKEPTRHMMSHEPQLAKWVVDMTPMLDDPSFEYSLTTRIHWILMGLDDFPECANPECHSKIGIHANTVWSRGYVKYCSLKCGTRCSREKCNETLHKHADENPNFFYEIEQKKKKTRIENHGDPNWNNRESARKTYLERYGVICPIAKKKFFEKSMKTREKKYGKGNLTNYKKTAQTCLERYGHRSVWGNPEIHKRCIDTTIDIHGSPNPGNKYEYDGCKFDSKPELAYYIWLKDNNIDFTCKPDISFLYEYDNMQYRYFPDFIVEGRVVEIKGDHFFKEDGTMQNPFNHSLDEIVEAKHQCMIANDVKIIRTTEYETYLKYVEEKYGKDYFDSFKKNRRCA